MGTELLVLAKVQHILPEIITISPIQTFSMRECAKTFDNKLQILEAFQKMSRMGTELLLLAVWLDRVLLCWRHHRSSVRQKENC